MNLIPGSWQYALIASLVILMRLGAIVCLINTFRKWRRAIKSERACRPYRGYRPTVDNRSSLATFRRVVPARLYR